MVHWIYYIIYVIKQTRFIKLIIGLDITTKVREKYWADYKRILSPLNVVIQKDTCEFDELHIFIHWLRDLRFNHSDFIKIKSYLWSITLIILYKYQELDIFISVFNRFALSIFPQQNWIFIIELMLHFFQIEPNWNQLTTKVFLTIILFRKLAKIRSHTYISSYWKSVV